MESPDAAQPKGFDHFGVSMRKQYKGLCRFSYECRSGLNKGCFGLRHIQVWVKWPMRQLLQGLSRWTWYEPIKPLHRCECLFFNGMMGGLRSFMAVADSVLALLGGQFVFYSIYYNRSRV